MTTATYTLEQYSQDRWVEVVTADNYPDIFSWYKAVERADPYKDYRIQQHVVTTVVTTNPSTR